MRNEHSDLARTQRRQGDPPSQARCSRRQREHAERGASLPAASSRAPEAEREGEEEETSSGASGN
ncbi:MAG: hypothetical protein Q8P67_09895 [archaeon]|nr:hypothetical protein [archaeon]